MEFVCARMGSLYDKRKCRSCFGHVRLKLYHCPIHEVCSLETAVIGSRQTCDSCPDYLPSSYPLRRWKERHREA